MAMTKLTPEELQGLRNRFDLQLVFGMGLLQGKPVPVIMEEVTGEKFLVTLADKLFVEGLTHNTFRVNTPMGYIDRPYVGEEKVWLQNLATAKVQLFLANHENTQLKSKLLEAEMEIATLRQALSEAGGTTATEVKSDQG